MSPLSPSQLYPCSPGLSARFPVQPGGDFGLCPGEVPGPSSSFPRGRSSPVPLAPGASLRGLRALPRLPRVTPAPSPRVFQGQVGLTPTLPPTPVYVQPWPAAPSALPAALPSSRAASTPAQTPAQSPPPAPAPRRAGPPPLGPAAPLLAKIKPLPGPPQARPRHPLTSRRREGPPPIPRPARPRRPMAAPRPEVTGGVSPRAPPPSWERAEAAPEVRTRFRPAVKRAAGGGVRLKGTAPKYRS